MTFYDSPAGFNTGFFDTAGLITFTVIGIYPHWKVWSDHVEMSTLSTEYVPVCVEAQLNGAAYNPTNDLVYVAFTQGNASPVTWYSASWASTSQANVYQAMCLVGPSNGGTVLTRGNYVVWIKVTDSPEIPARPAGTLTIY